MFTCVCVCVHGYTYVCVHGCVCSSVCVCLPLPPLRRALLFTAAYPSLDLLLTHHHENPGATDMHYCTQHHMGSRDLKSGLTLLQVLYPLSHLLSPLFVFRQSLSLSWSSLSKP